MNTANIGKTSQLVLLHSDNHEVKPSLPENLIRGDRVNIFADYPLFPSSSGTISDLPNLDAAIVELDTGERELFSLQHLKPVIAQHLKFKVGSLSA